MTSDYKFDKENYNDGYNDGEVEGKKIGFLQGLDSMRDNLKTPVKEVEEALHDVYSELVSEENRHNVFGKLKIIQQKINNLKALLPTA